MDHPTYFSPSVPPLCSSIVEESAEVLQDEDVFTDEHNPGSEIETVVVRSSTKSSPIIGITVPDQHSETKESIVVVTPTSVSSSHKSRIPRKEKAGSIVKSWEFSFQPISVCKSGQNKSLNDKATTLPQKAAKLPRKKLAMMPSAPSTCGKIDMDATSDDLGSSADSSHRPAAAAPAPLHRRQHGKLHTTRVEYLLQKYLGEEAKDVLGAKATSSSTISPAVEQGTASVDTSTTSVLPSKKVVQALPRREIKSIMQVKSEQDAAVRELQHAPRQFHAKPVPLSFVTPRAPHPAHNISVTKKDVQTSSNVEESVEIRAKPVPPATSEPRYALLVADSVLRRYGASKEEENNASAASGVATDSGLQKWLSWPAGQDQMQQPLEQDEAVPLKRPQTARTGRRSNVDGTHTLLPGIEEEV